jgi:hypothetical protein
MISASVARNSEDRETLVRAYLAFMNNIHPFFRSTHSHQG